MLSRIKPLLGEGRLLAMCRQDAVAGLLRHGADAPDADARAYEILSAYAAAANKRALEQLRDLEDRLGKSAALDRLQSEITDQIPMTCPSCQVKLPRRDMARHLWDKHRLVLDGLRAREPWRVIEDWVVDYRMEKDPALLKRCTELAADADGDDGALRLFQLMLQHGVDEPQARQLVLEQAGHEHATVCPRCFHLEPVPEPDELEPLAWEAGEYLGHGYRLSASERGPIPAITITAEEEIVYSGREPGRWLTRLGAALVCFVPIVLASFLVMKLIAAAGTSGLVLFLLALVCGLVLAGVVYLFWPSSRPKRERLIDAAWTLLVPHLLDEKLTPARASFLGSLALASQGRGSAAARALVLEDCQHAFSKNNNPKLLPAQSALVRLRLDDLVNEDEDPFPALLEVIRACLQGKRPLALMDNLLAELTGADGWGKARKARLKVLLAEAMFSAGIELRDLPDLAQAYPALATILDIQNANVLVGMRYLCSLESSRPWDSIGAAQTIFELAGEFEQTEALANKYPGLLLSATGKPIFLTVRGLWCQDICMQEKPRPLEVHKLPGKDGYQLILGPDHIWFGQSPDELAEELKEWVTFYFNEFVPGLKKCPVRRGGDGMKKLSARNAVACGHCGTEFLPKLAAVGIDMTVRQG